MLRMNFGPETKHVQLIPATDRICVGDSVALSASGSGTYSWTGPGLSATTGSGVMAGPSATATYSVTMTDPNGCVSESSAEVGVNLHPVPVLSGDTLICSGSTSTLTASGGDQYLWSTGDTTATIQVNPGSAAIFSVVVSDAIGCSASDSISVDLFPAATVAFDTTLAFFGQANGTATATASGGVPPYTFSWNINGTVQASATATGLAPGVYTVEVTDGNGCLTIDSVMVTEATAAIGKGLASAQTLTVSPNPASHQVILGGMEAFSPGESLEMELSDLQGRRVQSWTRKAAEELVLDISATVPEGVYQLMVYGRDHIAVTRLMVAR